jgi:putative FmdB family regulatory protein
MPLYEYRCDDCGKVEDVFFHMGRAVRHLSCSCGKVMRRVFTAPVGIHLPITGREQMLKTLNKQDGYEFPTRPHDRPRMEQAMAKGLYPPRPTIGKGFGG